MQGLTLPLVLVKMLLVGSQVRLDTKFVKVPNRFPISLSNCFIAESVTQSRCACLYSCFNDDRCNLACYADALCRRYSASVTKFWDPDNAPSNLVINSDLNGYQCYSSWIHQKEITKRIVNTTASPIYFKQLGVKENVVDGFYCDLKYYHSNRGTGRFYQVDFGIPVNVSKVIIKNRNYFTHPTHFKKIPVYVGNSSVVDENAQSSLLGFYPGQASKGEIVTFEGNSPLNGRYVTVKGTEDNNYIVIGEMKIIG